MMTILLTSALAPGQQKNASPTASQASAAAQNNTPGRIAKFNERGFVGDANITQDSSGKIGIGTTTPTSPLTVQGMIETTLGGYKFPDGTLQTTAGLPSIFRNDTLKGNGTQVSPLGVAVPLKLSGGEIFGSVLEVSVSNVASFGVTVNGGVDGVAVRALGGDGNLAGTGVGAGGGFSNSLRGGNGVNGSGGGSDSGLGGTGVSGQGGSSTSNTAGDGLEGDGGNSFSGNGGSGVRVSGGSGSGSGNRGGNGIEAFAGPGIISATNGLAGKFHGDVEVTGNLSKGGGSFKIDHPLDPENKYLYHSFVESPDMMNIYNGTVTTDANGEAIVTLPDWFEALNQDFRYQLTVIGTFAQAIVAEEIKGNRFLVKTNAPNVKVSWQVTGIRHDAYANKHRIPVEEQKPEDERGLLLHPDAFNQPENRGVQFVRMAPQIERAKVRESRKPQQ